jgi:DNA-directed RNA polymerase specialized sigma24 family protein
MLCLMMDRGRSDFERFVDEVETRVRRAHVAGFGAIAGRQAAADALAWAWQNWERVREFESPVGYLYRVGRTSALRGYLRDIPVAEPVPGVAWSDDSFEPGLARRSHACRRRPDNTDR